MTSAMMLQWLRYLNTSIRNQDFCDVIKRCEKILKVH